MIFTISTTILIHHSFWNCFEEVANDNIRDGNNAEDVENNVVANELDFFVKSRLASFWIVSGDFKTIFL